MSANETDINMFTANDDSPEKIISDEELVIVLNNLKNSLLHYKYKTLYNVVFINAESLYLFIGKLPCDENETTIEEAMCILEPYIPFTLDSGNMDLFLAGIFMPEDDIKRHQQMIADKAKKDFIYAIDSMDSQEEWEFLLNACRHIRSIKEKSINIQFM